MKEGVEVRTVRYRLLPGTKAKAQNLSRIEGACRYIWNWALARQKDAWLGWQFSATDKPPFPTFFTLCKLFTQLRRSEGHEWLQELPYTEVRQALKRLADAYRAFAQGRKGHPKFQSRNREGGFTIPEKVRIRNGCIAVPKVGRCRLRRRGGNPYPDGTPKRAVFKREGRRWFCIVFYEVRVAGRVDDGTAVGIDRNVGQCAESGGKIIRLPNLDRLEARRKRYQRRMARQRRGSNRRNRTKAKLARTSRTIGNVRSNWTHKVSRNVANRAHTVVIENLNTKGMTKSGEYKRGLNRSVLASGWGDLERHLNYKAGKVVRIHPAHTSQTCNACGFADAANRPTQSTFRCQACGHAANADVNAARNILASGIGAAGRRGALPSGTPLTRQTGSELRQVA